LALSFVLPVGPLFDLITVSQQVWPEIIAVEYHPAVIDDLKEEERSGVLHPVEARNVDLAAQTALQAHGKLYRGLGTIVGEGDK
jgi:hypothetical protein